jgi:putative addiction module component (TIGR02574 family)
MGNSARRLEAEALKLPARERVRLAVRLISSLDEASDENAELLWVQEAERRLDELRSGQVEGKAAEGVFRRARSALR